MEPAKTDTIKSIAGMPSPDQVLGFKPKPGNVDTIKDMGKLPNPETLIALSQPALPLNDGMPGQPKDSGPFAGISSQAITAPKKQSPQNTFQTADTDQTATGLSGKEAFNQEQANQQQKQYWAKVSVATTNIQKQLADLNQKENDLQTTGNTTGVQQLQDQKTQLQGKLDSLNALKIGRVHNFIDQFAKSIMQGTYGTAATLGNLDLGIDEGNPIMGAYMAQVATHNVKKQANDLFPTNPNLQKEFIASKVPEFMGNIAPLMVAPELVLEDGAGLGLKALATGITFALPDAGSSFVQGMDKTGDPKKAFESMLLHGAVSGAGGAVLGGADEMAGKALMKGMKALDDATGNTISDALQKGLSGRMMRAASSALQKGSDGSLKVAALQNLAQGTKSSLELGLLGSGQKIVNNFTGNQIYDLKNKVALTSGAGNAFAEGFLSGILLHAAGTTVNGLANIVTDRINEKNSPIDPNKIDPVEITPENYKEAEQEFRDKSVLMGTTFMKSSPEEQAILWKNPELRSEVERWVGLGKGLKDFNESESFKMDEQAYENQQADMAQREPVTVAKYQGEDVQVKGEDGQNGFYIVDQQGQTKHVTADELDDIQQVSPQEQLQAEGQKLLQPPTQEKQTKPVQLTVGEDKNQGTVTMMPQPDGGYQITDHTIATKEGPMTVPVDQMSFSQANKVAEQVRDDLAGRMANYKQSFDVKVTPSDPSDPFSPLQIHVIPVDNAENGQDMTSQKETSQQPTTEAQKTQEKPQETTKSKSQQSVPEEAKGAINRMFPEESAPEKIAEKQPWQMTKEEYKSGVEKGIKKHNPDILVQSKDGTRISKPLEDAYKEHLITKKQYEKIKYGGIGEKAHTRMLLSAADSNHKYVIEKALSEGKPVPEQVLKDYPELQKEAINKKALKVTGFYDALKKNNAPKITYSDEYGEERTTYDPEAKKDYMVKSNETGRLLRYVVVLNDGRQVSLDGAVRITKPKEWDRIEKKFHGKSIKERNAILIGETFTYDQIQKMVKDEIQSYVDSGGKLNDIVSGKRVNKFEDYLKENHSIFSGLFHHKDIKLKNDSENNLFSPESSFIFQAEKLDKTTRFSRTSDQTNTEAFKKWFGDSKVVDENGKPLVVYHGTNQNFDIFKRNRLGKNTNTVSSLGFFFTENPKEANEYADMSARHQVTNSVDIEKRSEELQQKIDRAERKGDWDTAEKLYIELEELELGAIREGDIGQNILPVYLNIKNPKILDLKDSFNAYNLRDEIQKAKKEGYDGLKLLNVYDPVGDRPEAFSTTQWIAFNPEQIKSATGNNGEFNPSNPDIRKRQSENGAPVISNRAKAIGDTLRDKIKIWAHRENITIADHATQLPDDIRKIVEGQKGRIGGLFHNGKAYVLTYNLTGPEEADKVLAHEVIGHLGIRGLIKYMSEGDQRIYAKQLRVLTDQVYDSFKDDPNFKNIVKTYNLDMRKNADRQEAGEEYIAWLSEQKPKATILDKFVKFIKDILRKLGMKIKMGKSDILDMLKNARQFVQDGPFVADPNGDMRPAYQQTPVSDPFYSKMDEVLESSLPNKGTPEQFSQLIDGWQRKGKFKKEELEWSGVQNWLKDQSGPIFKQDVLDYIRANNLKIEERNSADAVDPQLIEQDAVELAGNDGHDWFELSNEEQQSYKEEAKKNLEKSSTWYHDWTLPGGSNYTEMLFTLPLQVPYGQQLPDGWEVKQPKYADKGDEFVVVDQALHNVIGSGATKEEAIQNALKSGYIGSSSFKAPHFDTPNILAHTRIDDRTDRAGNKVLFLEEIQSDWHQQGRDKGYKDPVIEKKIKEVQNKIRIAIRRLSELVKEEDNLGFSTHKAAIDEIINNPDFDKSYEVSSSLKKAADAYRNAISEKDSLPDISGQVPNAPLKTTWPEFVVKRMIRYAAQHGYDKVGWTTGEQQADRYDLSKKISAIGYSGTNLKAWDNNGNEVLNETGISEDQLPDYIGKEAAKKLLEQPKNGTLRMLEGQNLKVGGEGMQGFYDKMIPDFVRKYTKKWDAKVSQIDVQTKPGHFQKVWSVDITPKMAQEVLDKGQPLFSIRNPYEEAINEFKKTSDAKIISESDEPYTKEDLNADESSAKADPKTIVAEANVVPFIREFWDHDIQPMLQEVGGSIEDLYHLVIHGLMPTAGVDKKSMDIIHKYLLGQRNQASALVDGLLGSYEKMFRKLPDTKRIDFVDRIKGGEKQPTEELQKIADIMRALDNALYDQLNEFDPDLAYKQHHFRILWRNGPEGRRGVWGLFRRPLQGSQAWRKQSVLDDMSTGIELGYEPLYTNPVTMFKVAYDDGMKYITAQRMWAEMQREGMLTFVKRGEDAPEGMAPINDSIARVWFPPKESGQWFVNEGAARLINNFLGPDHLRYGAAKAIGMPLLKLKNEYTAIELGLSAFHAIFESIEANSSQVALGFRKIVNLGLKGDIKSFVSGMKDILESPIAFVNVARTGAKAIKYAKNPDLLKDPIAQSFIKAFPDAEQMLSDGFSAGMKLDQPEEYRLRTAKALKDQASKNNYIGATIRVFPVLNEVLMEPLFEKYIPSLKVGLFLKEYSASLAENRTRLDKGQIPRDELARKAWRFVENRLGEMNFDSLFWNRTFKTANQIMFRSITWKIGTLHSIGDAPLEQAKEFYQAAREHRCPMLMPKLAWMFGLTVTQTVLATIIMGIFTGKHPKTIKDIVAPQVDPNNSEERIVLPTYYKDILHIQHDPTGFLGTSLSGPLSKLFEISQNKDYYGYEIYDPQLTGVKGNLRKIGQDIDYFIPRPFSFESWAAMARKGESVPKRMMGFFGFTKAPGWLIHTPIQNEIYDLYRLHVATTKPYASKEAHDIKQNIRQAYMNGDVNKAEALADHAIKSGILRMEQLKYLFKNINKDEDPSVFMFRELPFSDKEYLWNKMSRNQKMEYDPKGSFLKEFTELNQNKQE